MKLNFDYKGTKEAFYFIRKVGTVLTYEVTVFEDEILRFLPVPFLIIYDENEKCFRWRVPSKDNYVAHQICNSVAEEILYQEKLK